MCSLKTNIKLQRKKKSKMKPVNPKRKSTLNIHGKD